MKKKLTFKEQLKKTKWWHWFIILYVAGLILGLVSDDYGPKPAKEPFSTEQSGVKTAENDAETNRVESTQTQENYAEFAKNKLVVLLSE